MVFFSPFKFSLKAVPACVLGLSLMGTTGHAAEAGSVPASQWLSRLSQDSTKVYESGHPSAFDRLSARNASERLASPLAVQRRTEAPPLPTAAQATAPAKKSGVASAPGKGKSESRWSASGEPAAGTVGKTASLVSQAQSKAAQMQPGRAVQNARTTRLSQAEQDKLHRADLRAALAEGRIGTRERGTASWYANSLHGLPTSTGEPYDRHALTAAHPTLPMGTWVKVTRSDSRRSVVVRVNDRGPHVKRRILDLSYQAARTLGIVNSGTAQVVMEVLPDQGQQRVASAN
ncbi:rare lipoprotein A [Comamonas sp. BIGb0124]|uniref:septal ring lytic transglycosylase RlpA family protein n=1 Tax=Comamonas sp. BIGb0124 TaxID=2485130 RepID=UPI000F985F87|nr:septal ring lytic transglycosylase RlpA family protein [Comamonas sp. BIGb0124]ROR24291.1 rare lipoprotein A [Comamonas sp. BIGb0124]